jgi:hypothetical protein
VNLSLCIATLLALASPGAFADDPTTHAWSGTGRDTDANPCFVTVVFDPTTGAAQAEADFWTAGGAIQLPGCGGSWTFPKDSCAPAPGYQVYCHAIDPVCALGACQEVLTIESAGRLYVSSELDGYGVIGQVIRDL